jgi:hypothetical protein
MVQQAKHPGGQRTPLRRIDSERADFAAIIDKMHAELAERDAAIAHLKAERTAQSTAFEELAATRSREQQRYAVRQEEVRAAAETLATEIQALEERCRRSTESVALRDAELAESRAARTALEETLRTVQASDSARAARVVELEQLAASQDQLANSERDATYQSERLATLQVDLAHAEALAEQAEASRRPVENELGRVRTELQRETERAKALDARQRELALELERTRAALDERELQLRHLERYAKTSARVLHRIKVSIERGNSNPLSETVGFLDDGATLVPLDDSDAPAVPLGRHTTIGRAPESDLCLNDSSVSRRHAVVTIGPKGAFIEDLRSVNGVTVNRQRIRHACLADGDVIELGVKRFRFTSSDTRLFSPGPEADHPVVDETME